LVSVCLLARIHLYVILLLKHVGISLMTSRN
jgi:hypothetical protein